MAATHHPIIGEPAEEQAPDDLMIPTDVCPHCRAERERSTRYHKASFQGTHPWVIWWKCGSHCVFYPRPFFSISIRCMTSKVEKWT